MLMYSWFNSKECLSKFGISNSSASTSLDSSPEATSTLQHAIMQQPILEKTTSGN